MTATDFVVGYISELRQRAEDRRAEGSSLAAVYERVANELEAARARFLNEEPPIEEAVRDSGYSEVQLRRLRREGKWSGRRADLPRRPRPSAPQPAGERPTLAEQVLARRRARRSG